MGSNAAPPDGTENIVKIPLLRAGKPYWSLDEAILADYRTGEPVAAVSQANPGLIARDRNAARRQPPALREFTTRELIKICKAASKYFLEDTLPLGETTQSPEDYIRDLSRTTGLPRALARKNARKIGGALAAMDEIFVGLTRDLDPYALDAGSIPEGDPPLGFSPVARCLGAVLPSNSPGVHTLWLPAVALKTELALKPGREEPWSPYRVIQALIRAGAPASAFSYYPAGHEGSQEILRGSDRAILFGDAATVRAWEGDRRIQIHGPGFSKVILGPDEADHWESHLDLMASSVLENGGRSCINASGIWTPRHGREIAGALARRFAGVEPLDPDDDRAQLAAFTNPEIARGISRMIDQALQAAGAEDLTARHREGPRVVERHGATYLLPTLIWCEDPGHPLARRELLFPFASVVEAPAGEIPSRIGPTLVATAITRDAGLTRALLDSPDVDRLNIGPIPTWRIAWDQPHEGNLFEFLYRRRALQVAPGALSSTPRGIS